MKTLTNSSALFKPPSSISHRGHQHKTHFISEHKPKKTLLHLSTRKVTHNIKYPKNDNKTITTTTIHNPTYANVISSNVHYKVYEIAIDAFFTFLKHALNTNLYASIKQAFYTEISKATELCVKYRTNTNQSFTLYTHKHTSSISKALLTQQGGNGNDSNCGSNCVNCVNCGSGSSKPKKTNLKLSYDMYSSNNNSNSNTNSNSNYPKKRATKVSKSNNNINIYEQHNKVTRTRSGSGKSGDKNTNTNTRVNNSSNISKKESKQHSLFTLTKHKMFLQNKTQSTSKSHSKSKERKHPQQQQDYFPLNIKLYNKLNREHHHHHHTTNNNNNVNVNDDINVVTPNTTVVPNLNIKLSHNKHSHFNMLYNSNYFNSSSLNNHNNNNNTNLTTSTNTNRQQQQQHKCSVRKQKQTPTKGVVSSSNKTSKVTTQVTCKSCRERKSIQIGNDNNNGGNNNEQGAQGCEGQNSEQLREIKSNLDEDLKVMFNFSYEGFLNKADSESQSKISEVSGVSGDGVNGAKKGKVNGGDVNKQEMIYKRKYDY